MRIHSLYALTAPVALLGITLVAACSSGGAPGTPTIGDPVIGGAYGGGSVPALGPDPVGSANAPEDDTRPDTGTGKVDTGSSTDTGSRVDTGTTNDICNQPSKCSGDPAPTASSIAECRSLINGASCTTEYKALFTCQKTKAVCDASNMTDVAATTTACTTQQNALNTCLGV